MVSDHLPTTAVAPTEAYTLSPSSSVPVSTVIPTRPRQAGSVSKPGTETSPTVGDHVAVTISSLITTYLAHEP
jgi:hypothetical protein